MSERLFEHALALYEYLEAHADADGIYNGTKSEAFRSVRISQTYYSPIWFSLHELGCVETLSVGGHGRPSRIKLNHTPDADKFQAVYDRGLTKPSRYDTLEQQMRDFVKLVSAHEIRIQRIEEKLAVGSTDQSRPVRKSK